MAKPRIVIKMEGGLIQWITADVPMEVLIIDHDTMETEDTNDIKKIVEPGGSQEEIYSQGIGDVDYVDPAEVDLYFNQFRD